MNNTNKGKANNILRCLYTLPLIILTQAVQGLSFTGYNFHISLTVDTIPVIKKINGFAGEKKIPDSLRTGRVSALNVDTIINPVTDTVSFKTSKDSLDSPVTYHADDSMVLDVPGKKLLLYGKLSNVKYNDNELSAPRIEYDQNKNLVKAFITKDSIGNVIAYPKFQQSDFKSISDTIEFNMKSGKGLTKGTYTQQGEMFVYGEVIKKISPDVFYALRGRFTTCNLDTPHFAFVSNKLKFINKKTAFSGPVHPEFEGVPLPIYLPFGIYPLTQGRHSGLIAPSFTANQQLGLALEGLGYYKILSPKWDVIARGTLYSYGGWTASVNPRYFSRYHYQGNFAFDMQHFKSNFKGDPDFSSTKTFNIRWYHNADVKARPGVNFSANVTAGSSKYNSLVPNSPVKNFTNQLNSSITYAKVWKDKPYNLSVSANHNQNTTQRLININLPDVSFNVNTLYPFRRKEPIGDYQWYENLGIALNTNARSLSSFYDTAGNIGRQLIDKLQWGASHNVPITISLPQLGPFQIGPSVSYQERWFQRQFIRSWNPTNNKVDTTINKGFYTAREMTFGIGATTRIFGMYTFKKNSRIKAIRHEIRPSFSFNYKPDMNSNSYYSTQTDISGNINRFNWYEGSIYGPFSEGKYGGINFGIDNNVSMKVRDKTDTSETAVKKVSILDGLSITSGYNFLRDSFKLDQINLTARSNLFEKVNITANANFDPYQTNSRGDRIDKIIWSEKPFSLGTLIGGSVSMQSSFKGGDKSKTGKTDVNTPENVNASGLPLDEYQREAAYISNNPGEFADFSIPWSINLSYSLNFNRQRTADYSGFETRFFQDLHWDGSVNLSPKWKIGINGFYNITEKEIGTISMYLSREMHCWQMAINISPIGRYRFFNITINPKSGMLRDLRINRTRYFADF